MIHGRRIAPEGFTGRGKWVWVKIPSVNIPIPTKIDHNGWCTYPKMVPLVLIQSQMTGAQQAGHVLLFSVRRPNKDSGNRRQRDQSTQGCSAKLQGFIAPLCPMVQSGLCWSWPEFAELNLFDEMAYQPRPQRGSPNKAPSFASPLKV